MKRIELTVNTDYRLVMRASTLAQITNIKSEVKKQIKTTEPIQSFIGVDIGSIIWLGKADDFTINHAENWIGIRNSLSLLKYYHGIIGSPDYILVTKEPALKQLVVADIITERFKIYGVADDLKRMYGDLANYYSDWSLDRLNSYLNELKENITKK